MNQQAKKRQFPYVAVVLIVVAVLVVLMVGYTILNNTGIIGNLTVAAESENYSLSENELQIFKYMIAENQLYYQYLQSAYQDYSSIVANYGSIDAYLYSAIYSMMPYTLSNESVIAQAYAYAEQYLAFCEGAKAANVALDDDDQAEIDTYIDAMKTRAEALGVTFSAFRNSQFGSGVTEKHIRSAYEIQLLGNKYALMKEEEFMDAATLEDLEQYVKDNMSSFYKTEYTSYKLVTYTDETFKAAMDKAASIEDVKTALINYMVGQKFESLYDSKIEAADFEDPNGENATKQIVINTLLSDFNLLEDEEEETTSAETGDANQAEPQSNDELEKFVSGQTDPYLVAGYEIVTTIKSSLTTEITNIKEDQSSAYVDLSDTESDTYKNATELQKWLFGDDTAKKGDHKVVKSTSTSTNSSGASTTTDVYTWYLLTDVMVIDTEKTRDAYYILLKDDKAAETGDEAETGATDDGDLKTAAEKAEAMMAELGKTPTAEEFDAIAKKYGGLTESDTTLKESISEGSLSSTVNTWLFNAERKEGDISNIAVKDSGNYVIYFVKENEENWKVNARSGIAAEKLTEETETLISTYKVKVHYDLEAETA